MCNIHVLFTSVFEREILDTIMSPNFCNILCILIMYQTLLFISSSQALDNEPDHLALLDFKNRVLHDPLGITTSWNHSTHFCKWVGVTCNPNTKRVAIFNLEARKLTASIPTSIGNMTSLVEISLGNNQFQGHIPQELGRLRQLQHLNLSFNNFTGPIPSNLSHCTRLVNLVLIYNKLVGQIPEELFKLTKLERLRFGENDLVGTIPPWIGNFSSLVELSLAFNHFHGNIPTELGRLSRLDLLNLDANHLTGKIPLSIYNISSLVKLSFTTNELHGTLPHDIGSTLPNLSYFSCGVNNIRGTIPPSLVNISNLYYLDFSENSLVGLIPNDFGRLKELRMINFPVNKLGTAQIGDLDFITSLVNCTELVELNLGRNNFGGILPLSIGNLSVNSLRVLELRENMLVGSIPYEIGNLVNLELLALAKNFLNGSIPSNIGKLKNLVELFLFRNEFSGPIPSSIGNLSSLTHLYLHGNKLEGSIPSSLGQCNRLQLLHLSFNNLSGAIPKEVLRLSSLSMYLALDHNSLTGPLPDEVGELVSLSKLYLSDNKLSGNVPYDLGKCVSLEQLYLGGNQFEGTIPKSFEDLKAMEVLDLSSNNLSGQIPQFLDKFLLLKYLNLSYNKFEGQVPKEGVFSNSSLFYIVGNDKLCGGLPELHLSPCKLNLTLSSKKFRATKVLISVISSVAFIVVMLSIIFVCFVVKKSRKKASTSSSTKEFLPQISYSELRKSTNGFSSDNLIGSGSFGSVYKGVLPDDGSIVAVKALNLQQQGASKSFVDECNALSSIRHRNLLKIITSCSSIDVQGNEFKALVFNFMPNGNLDHWVHPINEGQNQRRLSLGQRLNIAIDIASALDYLHNHCEPPIVHCDLKPSNVLLDDEMVAHVGDFGLARFIMEESNDKSSFSQTMSLALKGSIGYIPPEYGTGGRISIEGDIFSYGIVLLEMIIGKRPTNDMFGDGMDIHLFTTTTLSQGVFNLVDPYLLPKKISQEEDDNEDMIQEVAIMGEEDRRDEVVPKWMEKCVASMLQIGLSCSSKSPSERTTMDVVVNELIAIKSSYYKFLKEN